MSSPCHIELVLSEKEEPVKKEVIHPYCIKFNVKKVMMCCRSIGIIEFVTSRTCLFTFGLFCSPSPS